MERRTAEHAGRETAYVCERSAGDRTILYVHGSGGTHRVWARQYRSRDAGSPDDDSPDDDSPDDDSRNAEDRTAPDTAEQAVAALDLSGHGDSEDVETAPGTETLEAYAADVSAVARETGAEILVGSSLGGAVVLWGLLAGAFDCEGAAVVGTGARLPVSGQFLKLLATDFERAIDALHEPDRIFHDPDETPVEQSKATMRAVGRAVTERDFLTADAFDIENRLGALDVSVLAIAGEYDTLVAPARHRTLVDGLPDGRLVVIEDAAHLPMIERPRAFDAALGEWIETV